MFYKNTTELSRRPAASTSISRVDLPDWVYAKPDRVGDAETLQVPAGTPDDLLTRAEVARYLRVSERTVSRLIRTGQLPASRIGRAVRIWHADLLEMLNEKPITSNGLVTCREYVPAHTGFKI
jgi:excisionase family DNA binding protein